MQAGDEVTWDYYGSDRYPRALLGIIQRRGVECLHVKVTGWSELQDEELVGQVMVVGLNQNLKEVQ